MGSANTHPPAHHTLLTQGLLDSLPGVLVWIAFVFTIITAIIAPMVALTVGALVSLYTALRFCIAAVAHNIGLQKIHEWEHTDWYRYYEAHADASALAWEDVLHVVIIPNYDEPLPLLQRTLTALAQQSQARERLVIVLAMEAREAGAQDKARQLQAQFTDAFKAVYYTLHPQGLPGEMRCKSANEAWAGRWIKQALVDEQSYVLDHICVTTQDADTRWHPRHFAALTALFALDSERHLRFWQAPIRYHGNIWQINPLLRIVNAYATAFELAYLAAPWWLALPMSSYALSLRLLHESDYWDGDVIADEWHMFIKAYFIHQGRVTLSPVMLPFLADATTGKTLSDEIRERYLQTLRHAWGSKEVGYALGNLVCYPAVPRWSALRLCLRIAHDILMAGAGWVLLTVGVQLPIILHPDVVPFNPFLGDTIAEGLMGILTSPIWLTIVGAGAVVISLAILFWHRDVQVRPARTTVPTPAERFWSAISLPLMPLLTLIVLAIPAIQAQTKLMLGQALQFRVSRKQ
jgi:hypothetical protein